jgi:succinoglycan biosynthesis transport protein ExoP
MTAPTANRLAPAVRPAARAAARPAEDANPARVFTWLRLHALTIAFCGSLLGGGLAYLAWVLVPAKYEVYAQFQVASAPSYIANQNDPQRSRTDFNTYLKTMAKLIKSHEVLTVALRNGIADLPLLKAQTDPVKFLDDEVTVDWAEGSEVVRIVMKGDNPDEVAAIVGAVKTAFLKEVIEKDTRRKMELLELVKKARTDFSDQIRKKGGVLGEAQGPVVPAGGVDPVAPGVPVVNEQIRRATTDLLVRRLNDFEEQLASYPAVIADRQRKRDNLLKRIEAVKAAKPTPDMIAFAEKDPEYVDLKARAKKERQNYQYVKGIATNPDAETVEAFRQKAEYFEAEAETLKEKKAKQFAQAKMQAETAPLDLALAEVEREISGLDDRLRAATALRDQTRKTLAELPPEQRKADGTPLKPDEKPAVDVDKTDLLAHGLLLDQITKQEILLDFEVKSPHRVQASPQVSTPVQKDLKKQILVTIAAGLFGFVLVGFGAVTYEMRVKKVSGLVDLKAAGPLPVVGVVPWDPAETPVTDPARRVLAGEAIDKLRSYVTQGWIARGATKVAVTSPVEDEGKAYTALGLANSLAAAGHRTLLIDFDLKNPSLHSVAGIRPSPGVGDLLVGESDPSRAVVGLPGGLYLLPAGTVTDDARKACVGGSLDSLLARLCEPFDVVVIHTPGLLASAEAVELARRADAVLVCALYRQTRTPWVRAAAERLASMEVPFSGLVYLGATPAEALC